jgi:hypothetical protein
MKTDQQKPRRYGVKTVRINVSATQQDVNTLKSLGGLSEAIRLLCEKHRKETDGQQGMNNV